MERTALSEKKNHYPWLDAMRLIASAVVLLAHSRNDFFLSWYALPDSLRNVFTFLLYAVGRMGHEAVVVFFVLMRMFVVMLLVFVFMMMFMLPLFFTIYQHCKMCTRNSTLNTWLCADTNSVNASIIYLFKELFLLVFI